MISSWKVSENRRKVHVKNSKKGCQGSHGKIGKQTYGDHGHRKLSATGLLTNPPSYKYLSLKAGVHMKAALTLLNTAFLPISQSRFKQC